MPPENPDDQSDTRPYLCIPYWTPPLTTGGKWDTGAARPLPAAVVSYACQSIHPGPYTPGQPLDVIVDVRNSGNGNATAIATVVIYWADPTVGFAKPNFFAAGTIAVSPSRTAPSVASTAKLTAVIPATAPAHVCLLACVSHSQDRAGTVCDPIHDRHWAQRNLQAVAAAPGAPTIVPVIAANPLNEPGDFRFSIGPVDERRIVGVAQASGTRPSGIRARLRLLDEAGAAVTDEGARIETSVTLEPLGQKSFQLLVELDADIPMGQGAAIEALLSRPGGQAEDDVIGSLGLVLVPPDQ